MPLKFNCPRCKKALTLPQTVAGSYVKCGHCDGRVWVPEALGAAGEGSAGTGPSANQATDVAPGARVASHATGVPGANAGALPAGSAPPPGSVPPAGPAFQPGTQSSAAASQSPAMPTPPAPPPAPWTAAGQATARRPVGASAGRKARFVTSGTAESRLQPAADGKLPGLKLEQDEPAEKRKEQSEGSSIHPLVLFCALCLSMLVSITMVVIDVDSPQTEHGREQAQARWTIEREYFSHLDPNEPLVEYQLLLRTAHRAHARGDRQAERKAYREVLRLLRAERDRFQGLTGSPSSDSKLEELITVILRE